MISSNKAAVMYMLSILVLVSETLSGCGSKNITTTKNNGSVPVSTKNPVIITTFVDNNTAVAPTSDNKIFKKIKDELGITFKVEMPADDVNQKIGVMIASGDLPDLVSYNAKFQESGDLIPLEDKIKKYAPDVYKHYVDAGVWNMQKDPNDGHTYYMTCGGVTTSADTRVDYSGPAFWIQKDVLKEAGYPKVTTLDQYFQLIINYIKKHPTTSDGKPTIGFETFAQSFTLENAPSQLSGHPNDGMVNVDNGVASLYADKGISKTYFKKLNDMYNQGIIDREAVTQNRDQYLQKIASGRVLGMYDQHWDFAGGENVLKKDKKYAQTYAPLPLTYEGVKPFYKDLTSIPNLTNGFAITKNCKDPDRVLAAINLLMNEKWQKILNWGIEGEDYAIDSVTKQPILTDQQQNNQNDSDWKAKNKLDCIYTFLPKIEGKYSDGNATVLSNNSVQYVRSMSEYDKEFYKAYQVASEYEMMGEARKNEIYYPAWNINIPLNSPASKANTELNNTQIKWLPRIIASKPSDFETQWKAYVAEIQNDDPKAYLDAVNAGIQYRINNWIQIK